MNIHSSEIVENEYMILNLINAPAEWMRSEPTYNYILN